MQGLYHTDYTNYIRTDGAKQGGRIAILGGAGPMGIGCINFFAGPPIHDLPGSLNLYRVHYDGIHVVGTAGSIPEDMTDIIHLIEQDKINAGAIVSHILGMKAVPETLFAMEKPSGAKKVCYNELDIPLIAIADLEELGKTDAMYAELDKIVKSNGGLWCAEAEKYLLENAPRL